MKFLFALSLIVLSPALTHAQPIDGVAADRAANSTPEKAVVSIEGLMIKLEALQLPERMIGTTAGGTQSCILELSNRRQASPDQPKVVTLRLHENCYEEGGQWWTSGSLIDREGNTVAITEESADAIAYTQSEVSRYNGLANSTSVKISGVQDRKIISVSIAQPVVNGKPSEKTLTCEFDLPAELGLKPAAKKN